MSKSWDSVLAWMKDQEQINRELLNAVNELASRIIVETSPTAPTPVGPCPAEACTTPTDSLPQSATDEKVSGLAAPGFVCAHEASVIKVRSWNGAPSEQARMMGVTLYCPTCGVWMEFERIPAPVAAPTSSTSAKPLSPSFVANSHEGSAPPTSAPSHEGGNP